MHITLDEENKERVLVVSQKLDKSCSWIINQILKAVELDNIELRQELKISYEKETEEYIPVRKNSPKKVSKNGF
jgi:hypothetical protein